MSSISATLRKKPNKQGLFPLAVRITKNRKSTFLFIGQYIEGKYWDAQNKRVKKSHPNSVRLNNLIAKKISEANDTLLEVVAVNKKASVKNIKTKISLEESSNDFFFVSEIHLENLKGRNKFHQIKTEKGRLKVFKLFLKSEEILLEDVTATLLKKFQSHLLSTRKISPRTVVNYLILIRTIYNIAITQNYVDRKFYPFGKGNIQNKIPETEKIGLNEAEIRLLENIQLESMAQRHALNIWLTSFYFAGIRIGDVLQLKWSDFIDGRLHYRMNKNQKLVALKIPEKVIPILEQYRSSQKGKNDFVFPEMKKANMKDPNDVLTKTQTATRKFNRHLKNMAKTVGIEKNLSCHLARHSFASIAGDSINIQILQKLYRHSSITTTINYQANFVHKDFDEALDSVLNF
jgi:integrase